jgi:hypothetical protein
MKNKIVILATVFAVLLFAFLYLQNTNLIADDKDGKKNSTSCTKKTGSTSAESKSGCDYNKNTDATTDASIEASGQFAVYEFVTDKIDCDGCKPGMSEKLMGIAGVKEVNFGETCQYSKITNVKVFYSSTDTTPEVIAASVKSNGLECGKDGKCTDKNKSEKKQL